MESQNSPHKAGFIFVHHIRACGMCTIKARRYLLDKGWSNQQIQDFFKNGMAIEEFEQNFGRDAMVQQVIMRAKEDG
jgi:hypothetical protein